jgi:uncharacterized sodium:solute symporter family permease YidK
MDLGTGQRTFCIGVSGTSVADSTITVDVPFVDSAGNNIKCSYFKMQSAGTAGANQKTAIVAELSGVAHAGDAVVNGLSAVASTNTSGILGVGVITGYLHDAVTEWHGGNGEVCTGLRLIITSASVATDYFIQLTYGNLLPLNPLRLQDTSKGQVYDRGL